MMLTTAMYLSIIFLFRVREKACRCHPFFAFILRSLAIISLACFCFYYVVI